MASSHNLTLNQQQAIADGTIAPQSLAPGSALTAWISMANFSKLQALIQVGTFGAVATVDAKFQQATDAAGAGAKDLVPAKAITQLLAAGGNDRQAVINLEESELDVENDFDHVQLSVTVGTAASDIAALLMGGEAAQGPASDDQDTSVAEVVA